MPRLRIYLTLSLRDADLLIDHFDGILGAGYEDDKGRLEKIKDRLFVLTEAQRPTLLIDEFVEGPPDDYVRS